MKLINALEILIYHYFIVTEIISLQEQTFVKVRKNMLDMSEEEWKSFESAFAAIKRLHPNNPLSYDYQVMIHEWHDVVPPEYSSDPEKLIIQHGNYWFLPWHRMYLYHFEKILQKFSNNPNLTIPYIDWFEVQSIPDRYKNPASAFYLPRWHNLNSRLNGTLSNFKYVINKSFLLSQTFTFDQNDKSNLSYALDGCSIRRSFSSQKVDLTKSSFADMKTFELSFFGQMDYYLHSFVHGYFGKFMSGIFSPADPIFWLHHSYLDRLWESWVNLGGGRSNPVNDSVWMNKTYRMIETNGSVTELSIKDVLDIKNQLGYVYDSLYGEDDLKEARRTHAFLEFGKIEEIILLNPPLLLSKSEIHNIENFFPITMKNKIINITIPLQAQQLLREIFIKKLDKSMIGFYFEFGIIELIEELFDIYIVFPYFESQKRTYYINIINGFIPPTKIHCHDVTMIFHDYLDLLSNISYVMDIYHESMLDSFQIVVKHAPQPIAKLEPNLTEVWFKLTDYKVKMVFFS